MTTTGGYSPKEVTWDVTKWTILRLLGLVYFIAFLGAYYQNEGLMGEDGIQPTATVFKSIMAEKDFQTPWDGFQSHPSIFWWTGHTDSNVEVVSISGLAVSLLVVLGEDSMILMALLWLLYFTIVTSATGTSFYGYGWESQLLETGFLGIFLCDVFPQFGNRHKKSPPSHIVLWLFRWLCFRISMGAGLIKIRGDSCWTQKTCLYYHFETQPIPSPSSFVFHFLPKFALKHAVDLDLFVQVYTSWMVLCPTHIPGNQLLSRIMLNTVRIGGYIQSLFMMNIILSGNFAFLNHLTIIPALACLDDACWPKTLLKMISPFSEKESCQKGGWYFPIRRLIDILLLLVISSLSWPVVANLLQLEGNRQQMNASFGSFRLVNTYGAFGSVGKGRYEPIISITYDGKDWIELDFPCKPGKVTRRPCYCAPYHYRLDWNIWFVGFKPHERMLHGRESWLFLLVAKILEKDLKGKKNRPWLELLDSTSRDMLMVNYRKSISPKYVKVDMFHYQMANPLWSILAEYVAGQQEVIWWNRVFEQELIPPVELDERRQQLARALIQPY